MSEYTIRGQLYGNLSSSRQDAELTISGQLYTLRVEGMDTQHGRTSDLRVSDRVGNIARKFSFDDGSLFETRENDTVDEALDASGHASANKSMFHTAESSWPWIIAGVLVTVLSTTWFFKYGLPSAAHHVAHKLPVSAAESMSTSVLDSMDRFWLKQSKIDESKQTAIRQRFESQIQNLPDDGGFTYTLHFREWADVPNALALPSGDIIVTDELAMMATDAELDSILLHEIAHVVERHSLEAVTKSAATSVIVTMALGDLSAAGDLATGLGVGLLQSSYSRDAEAEADDFALQLMMQQGTDPIHFATIMQKFSALHADEDDKYSDDETTESNNSYFSSHPVTASRVEKARKLSEDFNASR